VVLWLIRIRGFGPSGSSQIVIEPCKCRTTTGDGRVSLSRCRVGSTFAVRATGPMHTRDTSTPNYISPFDRLAISPGDREMCRAFLGNAEITSRGPTKRDIMPLGGTRCDLPLVSSRRVRFRRVKSSTALVNGGQHGRLSRICTATF